jgi:hypothetical protein
MIKKVDGGYQVFSESGKPLSKAYKSEEEAKKRLQQIEYFKHKGENEVAENLNIMLPADFAMTDIVMATEAEETKARIGGTCLVEGKSRNKNKWEKEHIKENNGKEVKFFMQEHGELQVKNIVGKVKLFEDEGVLKYDGIVRNTKEHPEVIKHAMEKEIDVSVDCRVQKIERVWEGEDFYYKLHHPEVRALCGVGIGGVSENTMDYVIAEHLDDRNLQIPIEEKTQKVKEMEEQMKEIERLKNELLEKEKLIKEHDDKMKVIETEKAKSIENERNALVNEIKKLKKVEEKELDGKSVSELKLILDYESKLKTKEHEGFGIIGESGKTEDIVVEKESGDVYMGNNMYAQFQEEMKKSVYR